MKEKTTKVTKILLALVIMLTLAFSYMNIVRDSIVVSKDVGGVNVSIDNNGKLQVSGGGMNYNNSTDAINAFMNKYKTVVVAISGIGCITMIAFFIMNFLKLGASATNPSERAKVQVGLVWSGLAAAGLGAVTLIVGYFYHILDN